MCNSDLPGEQTAPQIRIRRGESLISGKCALSKQARLFKMREWDRGLALAVCRWQQLCRRRIEQRIMHAQTVLMENEIWFAVRRRHVQLAIKERGEKMPVSHVYSTRIKYES